VNFGGTAVDDIHPLWQIEANIFQLLYIRDNGKAEAIPLSLHWHAIGRSGAGPLTSGAVVDAMTRLCAKLLSLPSTKEYLYFGE